MRSVSQRWVDETGSVVPLVGGLIFVVLLVTALVADIAMLQVSYRMAASRADRVAEAGAAMIDGDRLRVDGVVALDAVAAVERAHEAAMAEGVEQRYLDIEVDTAGVCVALTGRYEPFAIRMVMTTPVEIAVRACATPVIG